MEYRAYFFGNFYLSSIQQGIQAAHVVTEMALEYLSKPEDYEDRKMFETWAYHHKTMILKNGGDCGALMNIGNQFSLLNVFPHGYFRESRDALNETMTSVGVILPDYIYDCDDLAYKYLDPDERYYVDLLSSTSLAK